MSIIVFEKFYSSATRLVFMTRFMFLSKYVHEILLSLKSDIHVYISKFMIIYHSFIFNIKTLIYKFVKLLKILIFCSVTISLKLVRVLR